MSINLRIKKRNVKTTPLTTDNYRSCPRTCKFCRTTRRTRYVQARACKHNDNTTAMTMTTRTDENRFLIVVRAWRVSYENNDNKLKNRVHLEMEFIKKKNSTGNDYPRRVQHALERAVSIYRRTTVFPDRCSVIGWVAWSR